MPPHPVMTLPETMEATPVQNQELFTQAPFICKVWMIIISEFVESIFTVCTCVHILQKTPGHLLAILPCWDTLHTSDRLAPSLLLIPRTGWCVGNTVSRLYFNYIAVDIQRLFLSHTCLWRGGSLFDSVTCVPTELSSSRQRSEWIPLSPHHLQSHIHHQRRRHHG